MTHPGNSELMHTVLQLLTEQGANGFAEGLRLLVNEAMRQERSQALQAQPYERTETRQGQANGFKPKTVATRVGAIQFRVPQVRGDLDFYPQALEKGIRSEQALKLALAEMYVQGVSTRKVSAIVEELCGHSVSSTQVSQCAARLDTQLLAWRERPLGAFPYLFLDARYEKVRHGGQLLDCAILIALGVSTEGKRTILGVSAALIEAEPHWRQFLNSLLGRGLHGLQLIVCDDHAGLGAARRAVFPAVPWQRCQFHLQKNAQAFVPRLDQRAAVADAIRSVFNCPNRPAAERLYSRKSSRPMPCPPCSARPPGSKTMHSCPAGLHLVFALPPAHQRRPSRTSNPLERVKIQELKRRRTLRVARLSSPMKPRSCAW